MSEVIELHATGESILNFARSRGLELDCGDVAALRTSGWDLPCSGRGTLHGSRYDAQTQSYAFLTEAEYAAPPLHLLCMVREFDVGHLGGQLLQHRVLESSPSRVLVEYTSSLPWPFQPRWVRVTMRFGSVKATGALVVLGQSTSSDDALPPNGTTQGTVHYSLYHIRRSGADSGRSVMRRIINIDMHMPLPRLLVRSSLSAHYQADVEQLARDLAAWEGSAPQRRLREGECYRLIERALQEAERR